MKKETALLQAITDNFNKHVAPHQLLPLDEHMPIYDIHNCIIGYFNHHCFEDLLELLEKINTNDSRPIGLS